MLIHRAPLVEFVVRVDRARVRPVDKLDDALAPPIPPRHVAVHEVLALLLAEHGVTLTDGAVR